ncbi:MAG: undecaprenyl-diphosphate phosphatase [Planctomycetes bacterium]|nr:undecaprenyl-diphosphate phosphatase [Planctomycetota bacterium]
MTILQAVILGLVEGITEYLPISSTGHLILAKSLLGLENPASNAFIIMIQGGAILAVIGLYRRRVSQIFRGLMGADAAGRRLMFNLLIAFAPAAIFGLLLGSFVQEWLFAASPVVGALAAGGVIMILAPRGRKATTEIDALSWRAALVIGAIQVIAMWPGTSRSMVTILGGLLVGLRPRQAAEFSFLLGVPTLGAACIYSAAKSLTGDEVSMLEALGWTPVLVGFAVATISAMVAIRWLVSYLTRHGLAIFGWYRLVLASALALLIARGILSI